MRFGEEQGFERSFHRQTSEMAHRDNGRITLHSPEVAAAIYARVGPFVPAEMNGRYGSCEQLPAQCESKQQKRNASQITEARGVVTHIFGLNLPSFSCEMKRVAESVHMV